MQLAPDNSNALDASVDTIMQLRRLSELLNEGERSAIARRLAKLALDLDVDAMTLPTWLQ
jgi:hypothetical protein